MKKENLLKLRLENKENPVITQLIKFILGGVEQLDKRLSEAEIENQTLEFIQKTYKNNYDLLSKASDTESASEYYENLREENQFLLNKCLPKQLTETDLKLVIIDVIEKSQRTAKMGDIMKYLSTNYKGRYLDHGKTINKLVSSILKSYE